MKNYQTDLLKKAKHAALQELAFNGYRSTFTWAAQAMDLFESSMTLWRKSVRMRRIQKIPFGRRISKLLSIKLDGFQNSAFLLIGLAIENLAKGIVIGRELPEKQDALLKELTGNHDIRSVLGRISDQDRPKYTGELAQGLEQHIEWSSKYPVPKKIEKYQLSLKPEDFARAEELFRSLLELAIKDCAAELAT